MVSISKKFVKKPVEIEAVQFHGGWSGDGSVICDWVGKSATWSCKNGGVMEIFTLEGVMTAHAGDWIIKGVQGEFYPCKPEIFAATYAEVEDQV